MLISWSKMGCWRWDDNGREAQLCESLAEGSQGYRAIHSLSSLVTAPDWVNTLRVSEGWPGAAGSTARLGEVGAGEESGGAEGTSGC